MIQQLKTVAKILSYLIRKFFITQNSYIKILLQIIQYILAVDDEKLHYIRRKIVTQNEKYSNTRALAPLFI